MVFGDTSKSVDEVISPRFFFCLLTSIWTKYIVILVVSESSFCKTNFNMTEIKAEEDYKNYTLPIAYDFKSVDARERILVHELQPRQGRCGLAHRGSAARI